MWLVLAAAAFAAGQLCLFRCLKRLDRYLEKHPLEPEPDDNSGSSVL